MTAKEYLIKDDKEWEKPFAKGLFDLNGLSELMEDYAKQQREEIMKKAYADALIEMTIYEEGSISKEEMEMINKRAEKYYNKQLKK